MGDALVQSATIQLKDQGGGVFGSKVVPDLPTSITLTGAGFGSIANPKPSAWDTFNDYAGLINGDEIPDTTNDFWESTNNGTNGFPYVLDNTDTIGRGFSAKLTGKKGWLNNIKPRAGGSPRIVASSYCTFYMKFNEALDSPPQPGTGSNKICRVWDNSNGMGTRTSYMPHTQGFFFYKYGGTSTPVLTIHASPWPSDNNWVDVAEVGKWHRVELFQDAVSGVQLYEDGKLISDTSPDYATMQKDPTYPAIPYYLAQLGHDISQSALVNDTLRQWIAEVYESPHGLARVELSNDLTFDTSVEQRRFYQLVDSWSDSEITINNAFYGDLDAGSTVYAHIINSSGSLIQTLEVN